MRLSLALQTGKGSECQVHSAVSSLLNGPSPKGPRMLLLCFEAAARTCDSGLFRA